MKNIGLFEVTYFDPREGNSNVEKVSVIAANAEEAIRKAAKHKSVKRLAVEYVHNIGWADS